MTIYRYRFFLLVLFPFFFSNLLLSTTVINAQRPRDAKEIYFTYISCNRIRQTICRINIDILVDDTETFYSSIK